MKFPTSSHIASLDIGSSKIACVIARHDSESGLNVIGYAQHSSKGVVSGKVVDAASVEEAVRTCVSSAERMANININEAILVINGSHQESRKVSVTNDVHDIVSGPSVLKMIDRGCKKAVREGRVLLHGVPLDFVVDGATGVRAPQGMYADRLSADVHMVDAELSGISQLASTMARCHLDMREAVSSPYAAGLGCLTEAERDLGVLLIDFGGGCTSCALFRDDLFIFGDTFPLGGSHVTRDIAVVLSTSLEYAERLKTLFGSMIPVCGDELETVEFIHIEDLAAGKSQPSYAPRSHLVTIVLDRMAECVEILLSRLPKDALNEAQSGIVITGGGSLISGLAEHIKLRTGKSVRIGHPFPLKGLPDSILSPSFSASIGALMYESYKNRRLSLHLKEYCKKKSKFSGLIEWVFDRI